MRRRSFLHTAPALPMLFGVLAPPGASGGGVSRPVGAGSDRDGETRGLGVSVLDFKVSGSETGGGLFVVENVFRERGGPARHLHHEQDEWFYAVEGEFAFEIGSERFTLGPGDSVVGPRRVPHVWAHVGPGAGRIIVAFAPAGMMEAFFREVTRANAMPPQDPALWRQHGMELLGPPLPVQA